MPGAQEQFPKLRVIPIKKLILHEKAEESRVEKLVQRIKSDGYFRNPIMVADFNHGSKFLVLDGVHRLKSLAELACKDIVVQIVDYFDSRVKLQTWDHLLFGCNRSKLFGKIKLLKGINLIKASRKTAENLLNKKKLIGYFLFKNGDAFLIKSDNGFEERNEKLLVLMDACEKVSEIDRISKNATAFLLKRNRDAAAALIIPNYSKKEVLKAAREGRALPAGVTRHIVPNRVLGLDIDLAMLKCGSSLIYKNKLLGKFIAQRQKEKRVRFYSEPVFIFDE